MSGSAYSISVLAAVLHSSSDVRHERVEELRGAVVRGGYQVSPERIARSMLAQTTSKLR